MTAAFLQALRQYFTSPFTVWTTDYFEPSLQYEELTAVAATQLSSRVSVQLVADFQDYLAAADWSHSLQYEELTAVAATQLASRVSAQLVSKLEDYLDSASWSSLLSDTSNLSYLSTINGYIYDVYSDLSTLRYLLQNTQADIVSILSGSAYTLTNILDKVDDLHIDLTDVYSKLEDNVDMISQILGEIEADSAYIQIIASDTTDINENTGDILNFLQDDLDDFLVSAFAGMTFSTHLDTDHFDVTVDNMPSNIVNGFDSLADDVSSIREYDRIRNGNLSSLVTLVSSLQTSLSSLHFPSSVSVTNEVEVACDYTPTLTPTNLHPRSGTVIPATVPGLDPSGLDTSQLSLPSSSGSPVITLWENVSLAGVRLPDASVDLSSSAIAPAVTRAYYIFNTVWWLLYYSALALLLRREFVYYSSLGHTEGAA